MSFQVGAFDGDSFEGAQSVSASAAGPAAGAGRPRSGVFEREFREAIEGKPFFERKISQKVLRETLRLPSKAQKVIEAVALRQVQKLETDELKHLEELTRELELREIEWEARYLEALNVRRLALIDAEIGRLLKVKLEEEEAMVLIMLAASI